MTLTPRPRTVTVRSNETEDGITIVVEGREFPITYPREIWRGAPRQLRRVVLEHLALGSCHVLPLLLDADHIGFDSPAPIAESILFHNQLMDMAPSERIDNVAPTSYLRRFHNLTYSFAPGEGTMTGPAAWPRPTQHQPTAIVPFSFGKESLVTVALCLELGIRPVLVYCQEPSHPYEETYKLQRLETFGRQLNVPVHFVRNAPGLFRYGKAFDLAQPTELGWGSQTTLLALMSLPFAYAYNAGFILFGNEFLNNEAEVRDGWTLHLSFDQSSAWTRQQNTMIRLLTGGRTRVCSSLESLEEIHVFHLLHRRYPDLGRFQFSCSAEMPLVADSPWCHRCYKCVRMFLFARCCDIDPGSIGFRSDLFEQSDLFSHYFGTVHKSGSRLDLDFAFYLLCVKGAQNPLLEKFKTERLPGLPDWSWFRDQYSSIRPAPNLPARFRDRMRDIFADEMRRFCADLPAAP